MWLEADAASTISVYARVGTVWDTPLTASECYIVASYQDDNAAVGNRTTVQSTETLSNVADWTTGVKALTVTIPASHPDSASWVYIWFHVAEYDADEEVWVDIKPVMN